MMMCRQKRPLVVEKEQAVATAVGGEDDAGSNVLLRMVEEVRPLVVRCGSGDTAVDGTYIVAVTPVEVT